MPRPHLRSFVPTFALLGACLAQEPAENPPGEWIGGAPFTGWTRATGNWGGFRDHLEDLGIEVAGGYTLDWAAAWHGGLRQRDSACSLFDVNAAFDLERLAGLPRTIAYFDAYQIEGRDPSGDIGDIQGASNIQAEDTAQIAEVWLETWFGEQFRCKVGKVDFNSEFAFNEIGGEFVNSSAAITPCIVAYPTYPDPAMSVNAFYHPSETFYVGVGVYDGAGGEGISTGGRGPGGFFGRDDSDAYFFAAEVGTAWTGGGTWGSGRLAIGAFHHTATFTTWDGGVDGGTEGLWLTFEQHVWRENPTVDGDRQGLGVFAGFGSADEHVSAFARSAVAGLSWVGPLAGRDDDVLGFGVFHARLSDDPGAGTPHDETAFELLYKVQLTPAISLKPEVQYIVNPGGQDGVDDAFVGLLRLEVLF